MTHSERKTLTRAKRRHLELQIREYIERYHPELRDAKISIRFTGTIATVREAPKKNHKK